MFGLQNKLILFPATNNSEECFLPRRVIIPQGKVPFSLMGDFTSVSINTDSEKHVGWHEYTVDTELRCLVSNKLGRLDNRYTDRNKSRSSPGSSSCLMRNDLSKFKTENISSTQYGRGEIISYCTPRRFYTRGWQKPHESRDSQAPFEPDVPAPRYQTIWPD